RFGYSPTTTFPKKLCACGTPDLAIGTSAPSELAAAPSKADSAVDTAASTPTVTVGPGNCERCRTSVRTERAPSGRALVASSGRDPTPGATSPARVSPTSLRWVRAASTARHGKKPG